MTVKTNRVIGIDPGLTGFVALLHADTGDVEFSQTPTLKLGKKNDFDLTGMFNILLEYKGSGVEVIIEHQQAYPKQGLSSTFNAGKGYGLWIMAVHALGMGYHIISPRKWQGKVYNGLNGGNPKEKSVIAAQRLFPDVDFRRSPRCKIPDHNKCDAALIAYYGAHYA
ncbi:MAG: hypothetical protein IEMM0002_1382 [bacterium]|nr:MAG: hypothetical protein IEMM0002_1382 [bacterium]